MPLIVLATNVPSSKISVTFMNTIAQTVGKILAKPPERVMVVVHPEENVIFGMSSEPCGLCTLRSMGQLTPEQNRSHSAVLSELFESNLGIAKNRLMIHFDDLLPSNIAVDGTTRG